MAEVIACSACGGLFTPKLPSMRRPRCAKTRQREVQNRAVEPPPGLLGGPWARSLALQAGTHHTPAAQIDSCNAKASLPKRKSPGRYRA
jgi:rubredoxin